MIDYSKHNFNDIIANQRYSADGQPEGEPETENEDYTEYEGEESDPSLSGQNFESEYEAPKFRQLVKQKKLALKAEFGKAHIGSRRECKNVPYPGFKTEQKNIPYPCPTFKDPFKTCYHTQNIQVPTTLYKEVCVNIPIWIPGWRKKWREFKQSGGLAQLKMMAKGMIPYTPIVPGTLPLDLPTTPSSTLPLPLPTGPKNTVNKNKIKTNPVTANAPKTAGFNFKSIIGWTLALALVTGGIYAYKQNN